MRFVPLFQLERKRRYLLERLLLDAASPGEQADWRGAVLRLAAEPEFSTVSLANQLLAGDVEPAIRAAASWAFLASPVYTRASMTSVHLPAEGLLRLDSSAAMALAADFSKTFDASGWMLTCGASGRLYLLSRRALDVRTFDPGLALQGGITPFLAQGPDAGKLRALGSEMEMWLFSHPLNARRKAQGLDPVSTLWPWAGGPLSPAAERLRLRVVGEDSLLADCAGAAGEDAEITVHPRVDPGSASWEEFAMAWLAPAARALRAGTLGFLKLSCGSIEYTVRRFSRGTRWRRRRPWWEYFDADA